MMSCSNNVVHIIIIYIYIYIYYIYMHFIEPAHVMFVFFSVWFVPLGCSPTQVWGLRVFWFLTRLQDSSKLKYTRLETK